MRTYVTCSEKDFRGEIHTFTQSAYYLFKKKKKIKGSCGFEIGHSEGQWNKGFRA